MLYRISALCTEILVIDLLSDVINLASVYLWKYAYLIIYVMVLINLILGK